MPKDSSVSDSSSTSEIVPHSRPTLGEQEQKAVSEVVAGGWVAQGPQSAALEDLASAYLGTPGATACGSGTHALLLGLRALGIGPGSRVAIPAFTCAAVLYAVEGAGAEAVLLDCAEGSLGPAHEMLAEMRVDAVVVVHPWGYPLDAEAWRQSGIPMIEDCAQSLGARWAERPVGSTGDATVLSFYATKILCAGEGGLLSLRDEEALARARALRDYEADAYLPGRSNFKMSDLSAALARVQWSRLPEFLEARRTRAERYLDEVTALGLQPVGVPAGSSPSWYRFLCWSPVDVGPILERCVEAGVQCRRPVPVPLDRLKGSASMPNAEGAWNRLISLPIYPTLTAEEQDRVLEVLADAVRRNA